MFNHFVRDLSACSEFRQTVAASPPRLVHATATLLASLMIAALVWAGFTKADVVVRASGRVRPVHTPVRILNATRGESLSASHASRISEINVREGDHVQKDQVLVRLDTSHLDNDIAACRQRLKASLEELQRLDDLEQLSILEFAAAQAKAQAELSQAEENIRLAEERRRAELLIAEAEVATAQHQVQLKEPLAAKRVVTAAELDEALNNRKRALANRGKARVSVNMAPRRVAEQVLQMSEKQHAVKRQEFALKRAEAVAKSESQRAELKKLDMEREQAVLRSPIDGIVISGDLKVGDFVEPNKLLIELAAMTGFLFEAQLPTDEVSDLVTNMPARIKLDAYDYQRYGVVEGVVDFVSPDSSTTKEAETQRYLVRVALPQDTFGRGQLRGKLKFGMTGQMEVVTERRSLLSLLVSNVRRRISLG